MLGDTDDRRFLLLVIAGGLLLRLIWLGQLHGFTGTLDAAEATRVALAFARDGSLADAYWPGQGPTAHLLPISPMVAGAIMRLLGPFTPASNIALTVWSLAQVCTAYLLIRGLYARLGADPATLRWGTALLFLVPPFVPQETVDFRYWEGGLAVALAAANLVLIARVDARGLAGAGEAVLIAGASASCAFVSPGVGAGVGACWVVVALRRLPVRQWLGLGLASAVAFGLLVTPWALRNQRALGEAVLLRSNFGVELALANHNDAVSGRAPEQVFADRLAAIHPAANPAARPIIAQRGGEIAYAERLGAEGWRWIAADPIRFAGLYLRHLSEFFFPRPWQMYFSGWEGMRVARSVTITLVQLFGLIGLLAAFRSRDRRYHSIAIYVAVVALPYALFQPMPRYIFQVFPFLAFPAVEFILRAWRHAQDRRS